MTGEGAHAGTGREQLAAGQRLTLRGEGRAGGGGPGRSDHTAWSREKGDLILQIYKRYKTRARSAESELEAEAGACGRGSLVGGGEVEAGLLQVIVALWGERGGMSGRGTAPRLPFPPPPPRVPHQLAVAQATLRGSRASAPLHTLLLALGRPRGKHGGVNGERGLAEVLVLEPFLGVDPPPGEVGQEPEGSGCRVREATGRAPLPLPRQTHLFMRSKPWSESRAPKRLRRLL